jgi:hypothetical protein
MARTDNDSWDITESVGATALGVAAGRAAETNSEHPLIRDPYAQLFLEAAGDGLWSLYLSDDLPARHAAPSSHRGPRVARVVMTILGAGGSVSAAALVERSCRNPSETGRTGRAFARPGDVALCNSQPGYKYLRQMCLRLYCQSLGCARVMLLTNPPCEGVDDAHVNNRCSWNRQPGREGSVTSDREIDSYGPA